MKTMEQMAAEWLEAKEAERVTVEKRRDIEDSMRKVASIRDDTEGTETLALEGFRVKVVGRIDRKVDADKVQELAAEAGLTDHLSTLFRWKPEINMAIWKAADERITRPLAGAITAKPGRPSFTIDIIKE
jgi:histone H3/H4